MNVTVRISPPLASAALAAAVLLLGGCVWLRLLDLKDQFAEFDRYIEVPDAPGIELRFAKPVLLGEDLDTLIKAKPTAIAHAGDLAVRTYAFSHEPSPLGPDPETAERVLVLTAGVREGKVAFVGLPDEIFRVLPRELVLRAMRSVGKAQVDRGTRSATATVDLVGTTAALPTRSGLIALFGLPNQVKEIDGRERVLWRYRLDGESLRDDGKPVMAAIAATFAPGDQQPARFQVNVSGMWLYLDLPRQPRPAAAPPAGPAAAPPPPAAAAPDPPAAPPAAPRPGRGK